MPYRGANEKLEVKKMTKEFDIVFSELEAPDHPATCDQCGIEGTNQSLEDHECRENLLERRQRRQI